MSNTKKNGGDPAQRSTAALSLRERIEKTNVLPRETHVIPEWDNMEVEFRGITLGQRSKLSKHGYDTVTTTTIDEDTGKERTSSERILNTERFYPVLVMAGSYAPGTDERIFAPDDAEFINSLNPHGVDRAAKILLRLAGMGADDDEGAEGNGSSRTPKTASASI